MDSLNKSKQVMPLFFAGVSDGTKNEDCTLSQRGQNSKGILFDVLFELLDQTYG